ncbi:MAG: hypothetical protein WBX22_05270 [Silvibacterium sp.]|jgi:hypothetical protein
MKRFFLIPAIVFLLSTTACTRVGPARAYEVIGSTTAAVRSAFNADAGKVRVLMLVSPTCGTCLQGASEVSEQISEINHGKDVPLYVLWVPRRGGREKDVPSATGVVADSSARQYWDGDNLLGVQYKRVLGWKGNAWDVYLLYGSNARWQGDLPPTPDFFMHQTFEKGPQLDAPVFGARVKQLLQK